MKKQLLICFLLCCASIMAQQSSDAPWMKIFEGRSQAPTFQEVQQAFNTYWETHDKDAKGSGYKPFKRWEQVWKRRVKTDGSLPNGKDFYEAWEAKNRFQSSNSRMADLSNWQPIGPYNHVQANAQPSGQGRLNAVTIDPNNDNIWYVGSPNGGLWKTTNAGSNWTPMTDQLPRVGVSAIAVDYTNSDIIYIATGDDDADQTPTIGIMKSTDGGVTWTTTGFNVNTLGNVSRISELFIDPLNSSKLVCSTDDGVYISSDTGITWSQTLVGENIRDLRIKPGDASIVYCVSPSAFYCSTDSGATFVQITSGVPTNTGRMVIDVTPANPNYVYIFSSDATDNRVHGIYRSTNSGQSFSTRQEDSYTLIGNGQVWYNFAMGVSDTNPEELYVGVMDVWRSTNGGQNWNKLNRWDQLTEAYTHADIHSIRVSGGKVFVASDGGIYSSEDNGTNFTAHYQDLQIGEFFNVAVAQGNPNNISGGLQDNGGFGLGVNGEWRAYHPGDGINTVITPTDDDTYYGLIQNGGTLYVSNRGDGWFTRVFKPSNAGQGVWVTPLSADSNGDVYAAWSNLFKLNRTNYEWELVGSLGGYTDIMEIAPSDPSIIVSSGHQNLRVSSDGGQTLDFNTNVVGNAIAGIAIHKDNPDFMWITTDGDYENKGIFKTTDGGITWTDITGNFPVVTQYPEDIVHQGNHPLNPIYVSTDLGIYRLDDSSPDWQPFMTNLPNTKIEDLEINLDDQSIIAATYGRGLWKSSIPIQLAPHDISLIAINNPDASQGASCGDVSPQIRVRSNGINLITEITVTYGITGETTHSYTWNGSLASNEESIIDLPGISVPAGNHDLEIEVAIPNDANVTNNQRIKNFNINASGELNNVNSFENTSDVLLTENGVWERGVPNGSLLNTVATGSQAYATNLSGNYPTNSNASLMSHCYDFTLIENPVLKFQMAYDIEENWDWANVQYSLNGAQSWDNLGSINSLPNWYDSDRIDAIDCPGCPGAQWTGTNTTMTEYAYDFVANAALGETDLTTADNIVFRITLHSDSVINNEGMVIDDFVIEGTPIVSKISPVAFLQGAGINPVTGEENLMRDDLRVAGLIPTTSPYTDMITCDPTVFNQGGTSGTGSTTDDIVDWVWVELRDGSNRATVIAGQSALLQRDGDIVSIDGTSPLSFSLIPSDYHIKINHRNHLGIATSNPITLGATVSIVDFTADSAIINGGPVAVTNLTSGKLALYAGDGNTDGSILNTDILNALQQSGASGYLSSDVNMDTFILNNDIQIIIQPNAGKIEQE